MTKSKHSAEGESIERIPWLKTAFEEALALARQAAQEDEVPVGAVVVLRETGKIVGRGYNRREQDVNPTAHAEVVAIEAAAQALGDWRLEGCALIATLEPRRLPARARRAGFLRRARSEGWGHQPGALPARGLPREPPLPRLPGRTA
jgi:tRNA(adenine34) deaminase